MTAMLRDTEKMLGARLGHVVSRTQLLMGSVATFLNTWKEEIYLNSFFNSMRRPRVLGGVQVCQKERVDQRRLPQARFSWKSKSQSEWVRRMQLTLPLFLNPLVHAKTGAWRDTISRCLSPPLLKQPVVVWHSLHGSDLNIFQCRKSYPFKLLSFFLLIK